MEEDDVRATHVDKADAVVHFFGLLPSFPVLTCCSFPLQEILRYAMFGAAKHEVSGPFRFFLVVWCFCSHVCAKTMTGDKRHKDAFFDGFMNKTIKLQTKKKLLAAYGPAFVCQDGNCRGGGATTRLPARAGGKRPDAFDC